MHDRLVRIGLAILAIGIAPVALWATLSPRGFYDDFPGGGRHWIALDGPYNEHLVRDVGALSLALLIVAVWALVTVSRPLVQAAAGAFLVNGVLHLAYHLANLDGYETADQIGIAAGLLLAPIVAALVLVGATMRPSSSSPSSTSVSTVPTDGS